MTKPTLSKTKAGPFELFVIEAGRFRLDGGSMFGVVPKTLWERKIKADGKNRIPMAMRCLLIRSESTGNVYLIDNGAGDKFNEKMSSIYALDYKHSDLVRSLKACGLSPKDVTDIIFTHLHFDHGGGTTFYNDKDELQHRFPNATYHVNKRHMLTALNPNEREKASFFPDNIQPLAESERLHLVNDHHIYEKGLYSIPADGHTSGQQLPVIEAGGKTIVFAADLIPTYAHVPMPWVMGFDMMAIQTIKEKKQYLDEAIDNHWYFFLEHDAEHEVITVKKENGKYAVDQILTLNDL